MDPKRRAYYIDIMKGLLEQFDEKEREEFRIAYVKEDADPDIPVNEVVDNMDDKDIEFYGSKITAPGPVRM